MEGLHPRLVQLLKDQGWTGLSAAQEVAQGPLGKGQHLLLVAPTGYGKTEAALLPILSRILEERDALDAKGKPWPVGFKLIYVTPLRALNRDLMGRLLSWAKALDVRIGVRHGDTSQSERQAQTRNPPDVLLTTPETMQLLLYGDVLRRHLATVRFVVVDEVHDLCQSERGAQLLVALERLEEVIGQPATLRAKPARERTCPTRTHARPGGGFQRVGLSATVADARQVAQWLAGQEGAPRPIEVRIVEAAKRIELTVDYAAPTARHDELGAELSLPPEVVAQIERVRELVKAHDRMLIFQNTRDGAELMASRSALMDSGEPLLGLHHGSLSVDHRAYVEDAFKAGRIRALVATSSLELGIDVGAIDHVVQVASPRSVARLVQRLGRSGHRVGGLSSGTLLATGSEDALECAAVARRAKEGRLEALQIRHWPLSVMANQMVALANEYHELNLDWVKAVMARAGCFAPWDDERCESVWLALQNVKTLYPDETKNNQVMRSGRARKHFLEHISLIPDETTYRVLDEATKRSIGTVDDAFVASSMAPGALVVMAGRSWRVLEVQTEARRIRVAPVQELGPIPQWSGAELPVSLDVAQEVAKMRRLVATQDSELEAYPIRGEVLDLATGPIREHVKSLVVPSDRDVALEVDRRQLVIGVSLGTRGNACLGRITQALVGQRLGTELGMHCDAYRIHLTFPSQARPEWVLEAWRELKPDGIELLLAFLLRDHPTTRYHLVQVAKQFGALPKDLDPNRLGKGRIEALAAEPALEEEALSRVIHDRMDVPAVQAFLRAVQAGTITCTIQRQGPLTQLGREGVRKLLAPIRNDALLAAVRKRIEDADVLLVCATCGHHKQSLVRNLERRLHCRKCQSIQIAVLRPWNEDQAKAVAKKTRTSEEEAWVRRIQQNAALTSGYGPAAARLLVARGIGPDTAARILQKVADIESPNFWHEILQAELTFARTNAYWR